MKIDFTGVETNNSVPPDTYLATIYNIEHKQAKNGGHPFYSWTFLVQDGPYKGKKAYAVTSLAPNALFRLMSFLEVLTNEPISGSFDFNERAFLGRKVVITVVKSTDPKFRDSVEKLAIPTEDATGVDSTTKTADPPSARMF